MPFRELTSDDVSKKASRINSILMELSTKKLDETNLASTAATLDDIYSTGYRHGYAGILDVIRNIDRTQSRCCQASEEDDQEIDGLLILTENLDNLKERIRTGPYSMDAFNGIVRLSDHVKLEIHRLRDLQDQDYQKKQMTETIQTLLEKSETLASKVEIAQKNSEKIQMHMVAILGIFAAIVMAFSGGMNILSGAISISGESDLCNVAFAVLLCGIILFNIFAFLIGSITALIRPMRDEEKDDQHPIGMIDSRLIIGFNAIMMALLLVDVIVMIF